MLDACGSCNDDNCSSSNNVKTEQAVGATDEEGAQLQAATQQTLMLLPQHEKLQFFAQLDAVARDDSAIEQSTTDTVKRDDNIIKPPAAASAATTVMAPSHNHNAAVANNTHKNTPEIIILDSSDSDSTSASVSALAPTTSHTRSNRLFDTHSRKRTSTSIADAVLLSPPDHRMTKAPRQTTRTPVKPAPTIATTGVLSGRTVLVVPIGSDVSRNRVSIWTDMVRKLGGAVVSVALTAATHSKQPRSRIGINTAPLAPALVDWSVIDIVVASAQLERKRAASFFAIDALPPANTTIQVVTPEWLACVVREQMLPTAVVVAVSGLDWRHVRQLVEDESTHRAAVDSALTVVDPGAEDDDASPQSQAHPPELPDSVDRDGSGVRNDSTRAIDRAPCLQIDAAKRQRDADVQQAANDALVAVRTPVFFANNPGFVVPLAHAGVNGHAMRAEAFVCQKPWLMQANLNAHLTDSLEALIEFLHVERDVWREVMYNKAVASLKAMRERVSSVNDLKRLQWAKGRLRTKLAEVLETGTLAKLEAKRANPRLESLVTLARIWGVGPATAAKLYTMGIKTLEELKQQSDAVLTPPQQIGLKHFDDFRIKIPRAEVAQIEKTVVDAVHALLPNATALSCGSYRRGKLSSGDCDVLITDPEHDECTILPELLERLHASGFITDDLTHVTGHHMGECDTYMGVCRVANDLPHRRLDIKVYPRRCFGFAMLYFTGSDHFNRSMRLLARKKGWTLSDRALRPVTRAGGGTTGKKITTGDSLVCESEVDVFIALGMAYKDPRERNCFDVRFLDDNGKNDVEASALTAIEAEA